MTGEQFTKADWRTGKNRQSKPRQRHYGGQKVAPLAFLLGAKRGAFGQGKHVICSAMSKRTGQPCRNVAVGGMSVCWQHGGAALRARVLRGKARLASDAPKSEGDK